MHTHISLRHLAAIYAPLTGKQVPCNIHLICARNSRIWIAEVMRCVVVLRHKFGNTHQQPPHRLCWLCHRANTHTHTPPTCATVRSALITPWLWLNLHISINKFTRRWCRERYLSAMGWGWRHAPGNLAENSTITHARIREKRAGCRAPGFVRAFGVIVSTPSSHSIIHCHVELYVYGWQIVSLFVCGCV